MGVLYLPQASNLPGLVSSYLGEPKGMLEPSPRFFHNLFARWGGGLGSIAYAYAAAFIVGAVSTARTPKRAAALALWFSAPFVFFLLVPIWRFFDMRYVITSYAPFILLVAAGIIGTARGVGSLATRIVRPAKLTTRAPLLVGALLLLAFGSAGVQGYRSFRNTDARCSDFYHDPRILDMGGGFCRRYILLNTLIPEDRFMIRGR